jgi:hypothetical protein
MITFALKTGLIDGSLCQKTIKLRDFLRCEEMGAGSQYFGWLTSIGKAVSDSLDDNVLVFIALVAAIMGMVLLGLVFMRLDAVPYLKDSKSFSFH